jgi:Protein of unknown function (DUF2946)
MRVVRISSKWFRARAALAIVALLIQATVPNIVAAEINLAGEGAEGVFDQCLFAHLGHDADSDEDGPSDSHHHHDRGDCGLCPICLALLASASFAVPPATLVPVPVSQVIYRFALREPVAPTVAATISYRSRAPPVA